MANAVGYIRISTKDQSQYSLEYQENFVKDYCRKHNLNLLGLFKDDGESSYTFDRPDWQSLEKFIRKNKTIEYLIIFDHDRFSRNMAEALLKIKEFEFKFGIKVFATTDSFDTDFSDPNNFMMRAFKYMMAESELWRIRQRTKTGMLQGALNGRFLGTAPWGYKNARDENDKPVLIVNDERAFHIKTIFREFNRGATIEQIKKIIAPLGFTLKGNSAIPHILGNPVYAGMIKVPAHQGKPEQVIKGIHPAIISESEYWQAQYNLNAKHSSRQPKEEVPLRGVLKCPICNRQLTAGNSKGRKQYYWYYVCSDHRQINLPGKKLHKQLYEILDVLSFQEKRINWFKKKISEDIIALASDKSESIARTQKSLRQINEQIEQMEEKYLITADISAAAYKRASANLRQKQIEQQKRLMELNTDQSFYWQRLNDLLPKLHDLRQTFESLDLLRQQQFISFVFSGNFTHDGEIYRTAFIHPMFAHNELELKEKGLLIKEQPNTILKHIPISAPDRS